MAQMQPRGIDRHNTGSRTTEVRLKRRPDLFLSHSSKDKKFVRKLAEDLTFCEVDVWLDQWELEFGDSLHDVIAAAVENSRFVGVVLSGSSSKSIWARDELKQALSREKRTRQSAVLPILVGRASLPPELEDKIHLNFRGDYDGALVRLAGTIHKTSRLRIEEAVNSVRPDSINGAIRALRYAGVEPYIVLGEDDFNEVARAGGFLIRKGRARFSPQRVLNAPGVSPRVKNLMTRLITEVWKSNLKPTSARGMGEQAANPFRNFKAVKKPKTRKKQSR
jgi:hypothetical protein